MTYEQENEFSNYDPSGLSPQDLLARIMSVRDRIASTVTKLGKAESRIRQNAEEIELRVTKDGVIGAINVSSEEIKINAAKITLTGAVTVLSEITGELGTITAGDIYGINIFGGNIYGINIVGGSITSETVINVATDVFVGQHIHLGGGVYNSSTMKSIRFNGSDSWIHTNGGGLQIDTGGYLFLNGASIFMNGEHVATQNWVNSAMSGYVRDSGQGLSMWINSNGTLTINLANGKTATFIADSWTG